MAADVDAVPTFGAELKDGFKPANAWVAHGIAWLDDIQAFYRERAAIEKEYSAKLEALAKRYFEKKNKKIAQLSVGDSPAMTPGSLESASLTTWATQLTTLESRAGEHSKYADQLISQVAEPLKFYGNRFDDLRRRHAEYADKLEATREAHFADLRKTKTKYDSACHELEARRKKTESHYDKSKAQSNYQHQLVEMNNAKNSYLIAIGVTNRQTDRYYHEYVPEVLDSLQDLGEFRTLKLNFLWAAATRLEAALLAQSSALMDHQAREVERNLPHLDSLMYMRHNMGAFHQPPDRAFEPSPVWHDDDAMVVDDTAKIYLRNVLTKSKAQLGDLRREVDKKRREVDALKRVKQRVRDGAEKKDEVEVIRSLFAMQEDLIATDQRRLTAEVETATITAAVGDVTLGAKNHNFKSQTFKIPTNCDLCGERIWGLSAKGFDCRDCGYTCHAKCEMKVPADCPGEQNKDERKKLKAERQAAANALLTPDASIPSHVSETSLARTSTRGSTTASSHSARHSAAGLALTSSVDDTAAAAAAAPAEQTPSAPTSPAPSTPRAAAGAKAAATTPVRKNRIMAPPPVAYVKDAPPERSPGAEREEKPRGKMLYPFDAGGDGELSVSEGKEVVLLEADDGSGWVKVRDGYKEGLVPASYISLIPPNPSASRPRTSSILSTTSIPSSLPATGMPSAAATTMPSAAAAAAAALAAAKKKGPAVAPKRGAKKLRYAEALYDYAAQGGDEHTIAEGERFVLVREDAGDGWAEVEKGGVRGVVPANYIQAV